MLALMLMTMMAGAEVPLPVYPECGEPDRPDLCPDDLNEEWWLISYVPEHARESVREAELALGSGMHADRAWRLSCDLYLRKSDRFAAWVSGLCLDATLKR